MTAMMRGMVRGLVRRVDISEVPKGERAEMERMVVNHATHRDEEQENRLPLKLAMMDAQQLANLRHEVNCCGKCGEDRPEVHIDVVRQVLQDIVTRP